MAKLECTCGHSIVDQRDCLPYKGDIIPDTKFFTLLDKMQELVESSIAATQTGTWRPFIESHFDDPDAICGLKNGELISDLITRYYLEARKTIYQCEQCGRIWIQQGASKIFIPFGPEDENWKGALEV